MSYQLDFDKQKHIMNLDEYVAKYGRKSNKCELCGTHYKLPGSIHEPRDLICFSCECHLRIMEKVNGIRVAKVNGA